MVKCKICDVRDIESAAICCEAGVDFLGLHCIKGVKEERLESYSSISRLVESYDGRVAVVAVTMSVDTCVILEIVEKLSPRFLQLHSLAWSSSKISELRSLIKQRSRPVPEMIALVGVWDLGLAEERIEDLSLEVDHLILDSTDYVRSREPAGEGMRNYQLCVEWAKFRGMRSFVAGGIRLGNVRDFLSARPWCIDVQRGAQQTDADPRKSKDHVVALVDAIR